VGITTPHHKKLAYYERSQEASDPEDEMGRACSTNGGEEECIEDIDRKARKKQTTRKTTT
jgi:hypothetical protein